MRRTLRSGWWTAALLGYLIAVGVACAEDGEPPRTEGAEVKADDLKAGGELKKLGPDRYSLDNIIIDAARREIVCPGEINLDEGPLELLACTPAGKKHESLLVLKIKPVQLHVALLLLDATPGRNPSVRYSADAPQLKRAVGGQVTLFVRWQEKLPEPRTKTVRAEQLLWDVKTEKVMPDTTWAFQGSCMIESREVVEPKAGAKPDDKPVFKTIYVYGANLDGSIVTVYHDPIGIIENPLPTVNDDTYYIPCKKALPRVGTAVELVIVVPPKEKPDAKKEAPKQKEETK